MEELKRQFAEHIVEDRRIQAEVHDRLRDISETMKFVQDNHWKHIEGFMGASDRRLADFQVVMAKQSTDQEWTKKIMMMILGVFITGVGGLFFSLFAK